jgi:hypothetical protein
VRRLSRCGALVMLGVAATAAPAVAQRAFEGVITYRVTSVGTPMEVVISARGGKMRHDRRLPGTSDAAATYEIMDREAGQIITVIPAAKQYMVLDLEAMREARGDAAQPSGADKVLANFAPAGRTESIAGVSCDVYTFTARPGDEWCMTTRLGGFPGFVSAPVVPNLPVKDGAIVLRMTMGSMTGRPVTMVATRIDRTPPSASLFTIPSGFEEMKNPLMPKP